MVEENNPLDDELLKELGLEPRAKTAPMPPSGKTAPEKQNAERVSRAAAFSTTPPKMNPKAEAKPGPPPIKEDVSEGTKQLAQNMPLQLVAILGKKTLTLKEILSLNEGEVLEFAKSSNESVDLVSNGRLLARGDLVLVDGKLGVQIRQVMK